MRPQPKREISRSSMPGDFLRIGVAGDDDLLVRLDQRVEQVEELFLRAALAAEELDVVDQQQVERAVIALEIVERLVLVGAHDVGHVRLGMDVADLRGRILLQDLVADRLDQVRLAEAHAAVDEQRVVRRRMLGDLHAGGARELVGLAGDEGAERERRIEAARLACDASAIGASRRACVAAAPGGASWDSRLAGAGQPGPRVLRWLRRRVGDGEFDRHRRRRSPVARQRLDAAAEAVLDPLQHEPIRGIRRSRPLVRRIERADPGGELLGGELALEREQQAAHAGDCDTDARRAARGWIDGLRRDATACDWPGRHCSRAHFQLSTAVPSVAARDGAARSGVKVTTRVAGRVTTRGRALTAASNAL